MSTDIQSQNGYSIALQRASEDEIIKALCTSLYPGASHESAKMVLAYCKAAGLDPMLKPVHIVPMYDSKTKAMKDVVMPGVGLYRINAARTGESAGVTEPEFGPDTTENIGGVTITFPKWCKVTVRRKVGDTIAEFTALEFWKENYAVKGGPEKSTAPNAMWQKRAYGQLAKCAEAQAWRKGFPESGSQPTAEEMEGKSIDREFETVNTVDGPVEVSRKKEPLTWPADKFAAALPTWERVIKSGKVTAADVVAKAESSGKLTDEQRKTIEAIKGPENANS